MTVCYSRWNDLPYNESFVDSTASFKPNLPQSRKTVQKFLCTGNGKLQLLHTRLRTACITRIKTITDSPICSFKFGDIETNKHFFLYMSWIQRTARRTVPNYSLMLPGTSRCTAVWRWFPITGIFSSCA